jgi:outer membrane protein assembly factor BamA
VSFKKGLWIMVYSLGLIPGLSGQLRIVLTTPPDVSALLATEELPPLPDWAVDSAGVSDTLAGWIESAQGRGYWTASVDNLQMTDSLATGDLYCGPRFRCAGLHPGRVPEELLNATGLRAALYGARDWSWPDINALKTSILAYAEDHGYPFASVGLDSVSLTGTDLQASLSWEPGPYIVFDRPVTEGTARISKQYLSHYLGILPGAAYSEALIRSSASRLRDLPFLTMSREPTVIFSGNQAEPYFFLEPGRASRFDFVLGLLPRTATTAGQVRSDILLTGTIDAEFANALGRGEQFAFRFEQLRPGTPQLHIDLNYPYPAGLPLGLTLEFDLQKFDTTFLNLVSTAGIQYLFSAGNSLTAFWQNESSRLLSINESALRSNRQLPEVLDVRNTIFGLEYNRQELDYRFNPLRGWRLRIKGAAGLKRVQPSRLITDLTPAEDGFAFGSLYDSLTLRSTQYRIQGDLATFLPLSNRTTFMAGSRFGWILSNQPVFVNEQYRLGGYRLLRGFDEQSIFATRYHILTLELRLLLDRNSRIFLFSDIGYLENITTNSRIIDRPMGFGSGLTFDTPAGIFALTLAFGRQLSNPVDWSAPKIHFGYVSLF